MRELACQLTSSWPPTRVEGRVWALLGPARANSANPVNPVNRVRVPECSNISPCISDAEIAIESREGA